MSIPDSTLEALLSEFVLTRVSKGERDRSPVMGTWHRTARDSLCVTRFLWIAWFAHSKSR